MIFDKKKSPWEKEWAALEKKEARFAGRLAKDRSAWMNQKLEKFVPDRLQETLDFAFYKAFVMVFEKGTKIIEKTYRKDKQEYTYQVNEFAAGLKGSGRNIRAFSKQAKASSRKNMAIAGVEGIGTGLLGIGIPDIPVFTAVLLKSVYEIALSYGYDYRSQEERKFILQLIGTAIARGGEQKEQDESVNRMLASMETAGRRMAAGEQDAAERRAPADEQSTAELMKWTAAKLSEELLYLKFVQGLPVVGVIGGLSDTVYLKRITDYAVLKYQRRFLYANRDKWS